MPEEIRKPADARQALMMQAMRSPSRRFRKPPSMPPKQKQHIVSVKFRLSAEGVQPNSAARGAFRIDQA